VVNRPARGPRQLPARAGILISPSNSSYAFPFLLVIIPIHFTVIIPIHLLWIESKVGSIVAELLWFRRAIKKKE